MGMFDRVRVDCPKCGESVEFQSKAGECRLEDYDSRFVPVAVAADLHGDTETCRNCGADVQLRACMLTSTVPMTPVVSPGASVRCDNCDWAGHESDVCTIHHYHERVEPGEPVPAGECPECGALAHTVDHAPA